ncbi:Uncharacterized protein Rs2_05730 [Raphanus sativus]|nr:Uncharacterized protein Rs2_05730 [Raphanus sativus]
MRDGDDEILLERKPCNLIMYLTKLQGTFLYSFISSFIALDYNKQEPYISSYTICCLHTLLRQTYTRNNPRFSEHPEPIKTIVGLDYLLLQRMSQTKINYMTLYVKDSLLSKTKSPWFQHIHGCGTNPQVI